MGSSTMNSHVYSRFLFSAHSSIHILHFPCRKFCIFYHAHSARFLSQILHILPCKFCSFPIACSAYSTMHILLVSYRIFCIFYHAILLVSYHEFCIFYHANSSRFLSRILHILPCKFFSFPIAYSAYSTMQILLVSYRIFCIFYHANSTYSTNANSARFRSQLLLLR